MCLEGIGLPKVLLSPSPLPEPIPGRKQLATSVRTWSNPRSHPPMARECFRVGMAGDSRHVFLCPHHQGVLCRVHLGRGAVDAGQGE